MSRSFASASSMYAENAAAVVSNVPLTMACWFNPVATGVASALMAIGNSAATARFQLNTSTGNVIQATANDGGGAVGSASTSTTLSATVWSHAAAVFASATSRSAYLNGAGKGTDANTVNMTALNVTNVATRYNAATRGAFMNGLLAEAGIWSVALNDDEVACLAAGISPLLIRPTSLVAYWPLIGRYSPEIDLRGRFDLTLTNTPVVADHPRILYPDASEILVPTPAAAAGARRIVNGGLLNHPLISGGLAA